MASELCIECEEPMVLVERATGERFLTCLVCGTSRCDEENELVHVTAGEPSTFCFTDHDAKPQGFRCGRTRVSAVKKKAQECLNRLCQHFNIPVRFKKDMEILLDQAKLQRQHDAITGAVFLAYLREQQEQDSSTNKPTLRQVAGVLGIRMSKIAGAMKQLQGLLHTGNHSKSGAITSASGLVSTIIPTVTLYDPFVPEIDVSDRVTSLSGKIITLVQRKTTHSFDPNSVAIAAHFLAWQSCFFYQKAYHSNIPIDQLKKPGKSPTIENHLELLKLDRSMLVAVRRRYLYIVSELAELLDKMPWIIKKARVPTRNQIPEHLEAILDFQEVVCDVLSEEAEIKRRNQIHIQPVIPRELTAEEEAVLDAPELSEKDLPDSELNRYLRTAKEVDSIEQLIESEESDSET